jgi:hypothetical protein
MAAACMSAEISADRLGEASVSESGMGHLCVRSRLKQSGIARGGVLGGPAPRAFPPVGVSRMLASGAPGGWGFYWINLEQRVCAAGTSV